MTILELTKEVRNEETTKHKAHGQQGSVGIGPLNLNMNSFVALWVDVHLIDWVERVIHCVVQMLVVQNQRVGFEDLIKGKKTVVRYDREHKRNAK